MSRLTTPKTSESLVHAATVAGRRLIAGATGANGVPTPGLNSLGIECAGYNDLLLQAKVSVGTSADATVWWWYDTMGDWMADTGFGTKTLTTAASPWGFKLATAGATRVYVQLANFVGAGAAADVWVDGLLPSVFSP